MMLSKFFGFLYFLVIIQISFGESGSIKECSFQGDTTVNVDAGGFVFFQSPSFPKTVSNSLNSSSCGIRFLNDPSSMLYLALTNGRITNFVITNPDTHQVIQNTTGYISNSQIFEVVDTTGTLSFQLMPAPYHFPWSAFEGVVVSYDVDSGQRCPFSEKVHDLNSYAKNTIPISSDFTFTNAKVCTWNFTIADNQQLKIVLKEIKSTVTKPDFSLILVNEKGESNMFNIIIDKADPKALYFSGKNFQLTFNRGTNDPTTFFALVSAVDTTVPLENNCDVDTSSPVTTIVSKIDLVKGYDPNYICKHTINIPAGHEAFLTAYSYTFERDADKLEFFTPNGTTVLSDVSDSVLTHDADGTIIKFITDGSIQQAGFSFGYIVPECKCSDSTITLPCQKALNTYPMPNEIVHYCSNMACNYTVVNNPDCPNQYYVLDVFTSFRKDINNQPVDKMLIYSGNNLDMNLTDTDTFRASIGYSPSASLTAYFTSGPSPSPIVHNDVYWDLMFTPIDPPTINKVTLDKWGPSYAYWINDLKKNQALTVCSVTKDLEVFVTDTYRQAFLNQFVLYDSDDLNNFLTSLNDNDILPPSNGNIPRRLTSKSGCFTLYRSTQNYDVSVTAYFRVKNNQASSCMSEPNVYQTYDICNNCTINIKATNDDFCEAVILASNSDRPGIGINAINVISGSGNISFTSTLNRKSYMVVVGSQASLWQNIGIYTPALSVTVPPGVEISLTATNILSSYNIHSPLDNSPQAGIIVTPSYGGFTQNLVATSLLYNFTFYKNMDITFRVINRIGDAMVAIDDLYTFSEIGQDQTITTRGSSVTFAESSTNNSGILIEYGMKVSDYQGDISTTTHSNDALMTTMNLGLLGLVFMFLLI